jgi:hypothetical protein
MIVPARLKAFPIKLSLELDNLSVDFNGIACHSHRVSKNPTNFDLPVLPYNSLIFSC